MDNKNVSIVLVSGLVAMSIATVAVNLINTPDFALPTVSYVAEEPATRGSEISTVSDTGEVFSEEELEEILNQGKEDLKSYELNLENLDKNTKNNVKVKTQFPIDLNTATQEQLEEIPKIGPKTAGDIIAYRNLCGGNIASVEELGCIKGIGEKTIQILSEYLYVYTDNNG